MRTTLAIPNYNGLANLTKLLPAMLEEGFEEIYVLDDASSDDSVRFVEESFPEVTLVKGNSNLGPGGNRNRMLEHSHDSLVVFLDADMELIFTDTVARVRDLFQDPQLGVAGGLILNKAGHPMHWNYGYEMHPMRDEAGGILEKVAEMFRHDEAGFAKIKQLADRFTHNLTIKYEQPQERVVDWVAEAFMAVDGNIFRAVGGYDEKMRYHETHDLSRRIRETGRIVKFTPTLSARHLEIDVRGGMKLQDFYRAQLHFFRKHWGMSRRVYLELYPQAAPHLGEEP